MRTARSDQICRQDNYKIHYVGHYNWYMHAIAQGSLHSHDQVEHREGIDPWSDSALQGSQNTNISGTDEGVDMIRLCTILHHDIDLMGKILSTEGNLGNSNGEFTAITGRNSVALY